MESLFGCNGGDMPKLTKAEVEKIKSLLDEYGELPRELRWVLFPPEKQEAELVYAGKRREEDIFADVMAVPLQPMRSFGEQTLGWQNRLIFRTGRCRTAPSMIPAAIDSTPDSRITTFPRV
jgi:hypothetical protein